ncbi:MAG: Gfo/Idh/MocA family oxidoreductase [Planctomycetes bacterium]|nr:Gfo/Idh/MocA family oxidoreductase [Planctomycetota bacterium]
MSEQPTRRDFLGYAGLAAGTLAAGHVAAAASIPANQQQAANGDKPTPPSEKVTVGLIGCGGMGRYNLRESLRLDTVQCAAVCDVDTRHIKDAQADVQKSRGTTPEGYRDYRELLDRKDIDVVIIATPDHWHALTMIEACLAGKDVYLEKPIGHNIVEGRAMVTAAQKCQRVVQVGTQQRSGRHFQKAIELVKSGLLGKIALTRTFNVDNDFWTNPIGKPADSDPPAELDYDRWLGPAPQRPYNEKRCHYWWRYYFDYGSGKCGDWNVHLQDIVHLAMDAWAPISVAAGGGVHAIEDIRETYDTLEAVYDFPGFTQIYSYRATNASTQHDRKYGIVFYGTCGTLVLDREGYEIFPETSTEQVDGLEIGKNRIAAETAGGSDQHWPHIQNFYECVKSRQTPISDIESMHKTTAACHLANIALRCGYKVYWDAQKEICTDKEGRPIEPANQLLGREYRPPWKLPEV